MFLTFVPHLPGTPLAQAIGLLAALTGFIGMTSKGDRRFFALSMCGSALWCLHFSLMAAWPAAFSVAIVCLRSGCAAMRVRGLYPALFFVAVGLGVGSLTVHSPVGVLPVAASASATLGAFLLSGARMRLAYMSASLLWLVHNALVGSFGGILGELANFSAGAFAVFRLTMADRARA